MCPTRPCHPSSPDCCSALLGCLQCCSKQARSAQVLTKLRHAHRLRLPRLRHARPLVQCWARAVSCCVGCKHSCRLLRPLFLPVWLCLPFSPQPTPPHPAPWVNSKRNTAFYQVCIWRQLCTHLYVNVSMRNAMAWAAVPLGREYTGDRQLRHQIKLIMCTALVSHEWHAAHGTGGMEAFPA